MSGRQQDVGSVQRPILLREYQSETVDLADHVANALAVAAKGKLTVTASGTAGRWTITATSYVGAVVLPDVSVSIRPKVDLETLFVLLDAGMPDGGWRSEVFGFGTYRELLPAFAAFVARTIEQVTARGLIRAYRSEAERLLAIRGRIDFPTQLRQPGLPSPIACRFDELTADVPENRFLLGAIERLLLTIGVDAHTRSLLQHTKARFEGVVAEQLTSAAIERLVSTRLTEHYQPALRLAALLAQAQSLADRPSGGDPGGKPEGAVMATAFLLDMNQVFEDFVTRRLRKALSGRLAVLDQHRIFLDETGVVPIRPDLVFQRRERTVFVADVKYKLAPDGLARSSDYYQLLAYCTALGLGEGVLIYAQTDNTIPDVPIVVRHAGIRLFTYRLDLSGGSVDIETSIGRLAEWFMEREQSVVSVLPAEASQR